MRGRMPGANPQRGLPQILLQAPRSAYKIKCQPMLVCYSASSALNEARARCTAVAPMCVAVTVRKTEQLFTHYYIPTTSASAATPAFTFVKSGNSSASQRVGPRFNMQIGMPSSRARRANRKAE